MAKRPKPTRLDAARSVAVHPLFSSLDTQTIYCGDNLAKLRELPDKFVDLIYIDPPFNSNRNYEIFSPRKTTKPGRSRTGTSPPGPTSITSPQGGATRPGVKSTGGLHYHCDWHASHYVKQMLDDIFGANNFQNEIVWKRNSAHSNTKQGAKNYGRIHDVMFFCTRGKSWTFNTEYLPYSQEYIESHYRYVEEGTGRRYRKGDMTANKAGGDTSFEWRGVRPYAGRYWAYTKEKMEEFEREGSADLHEKRDAGVQALWTRCRANPSKMSGWDDIQPLNSQALERVGYPTQKPLPLLERVIRTSSNPDDVVLDAFCGCGTALVAAQNLGRRWIGIDISPTACNVMADRLERDCRWLGQRFQRRRMRPRTRTFCDVSRISSSRIGPSSRSVYPQRGQGQRLGDRWTHLSASHMPGQSKADESKFNFMDHWYPVQAKQVGFRSVPGNRPVLGRDGAGTAAGRAISSRSDSPALPSPRRDSCARMSAGTLSRSPCGKSSTKRTTLR